MTQSKPMLQHYAHAEVQTTGHPNTLVRKLSTRVKGLEDARIAADRERRFRSLQATALGARRQELSWVVSPRAAIRVAQGKSFDASLIEDRDYDLSEVVGPQSRSPRAVVADDSSLVLVLGGRPRNGDWVPLLAPEATGACSEAAQRMVQTPDEIASGAAPTLTGGVGETFNEDIPPTEHTGGRALNALIFFQLFRSLAVKRLVGYGNLLLQVYCPTAFSALQAEKLAFLEHKRSALYPCDSSVFSSTTFEFGGPHRRTSSNGQPDRFQAGAWSVLHALGNYAPTRGGHVIFWDLGIVVCFPSGSTILIPTGVIHYSFVKVREDEFRYSLLQWAGAGISRWLANGHRTDLEFAVHATAAEHAQREETRMYAHMDAVDAFPLEEELPDEDISYYFPFVGTDPRVDDDAKPQAL
ncbi:hypothetical protein B0H15DRAFT_801511 [Mycena belliarum]|uniref:Uncharacterized protein n=1 Tax=Mycena belliarum TaxID=1033014 RepID=A0AAD6U769_9AGAR|nr:hypothetical protein B0H15DRAFT_801511 [Mycena belliae]